MSSSHGAGRALSRREAKMKLNVSEFEKEMEGIVGNIGEKTLDEAPQAYQDIYEVMSAQKKVLKLSDILSLLLIGKGENYLNNK